MENSFSSEIKTRVRQSYPFPIAHAYKKTMGYLDNDHNKLKCILETAETTVQFLALLALAQLNQDLNFKKVISNSSLVDSIGKNLLLNPSFGKWKRLLLDVLITYKGRKQQLVVTDLFDFCFKESSRKKLPLQPVINKVIDPLISLRNDFHHGRLPEIAIEDKVTESLLLLNQLMEACRFLKNFELVFISQIVFDSAESKRPYAHDMVQMTGSFSSFDQERWHSDCNLDQGAILVLNRHQEQYITCTPFLCFADQIPAQGIQDIYLLNKIQKNKAIYTSVQFGRELQTGQSEWSEGTTLLDMLKRFEERIQETESEARAVPEFEEDVTMKSEPDSEPPSAPGSSEESRSVEKTGIHKNPFKFLDYFEAEDEDIFFGRQQEIQDLMRKFHQSDLVIVHGESGTGKTSLVKAGLIPQLSAEVYVPVYVRMLHQPLKAIQKEVVSQLDLERDLIDAPLPDFFKRQSGVVSRTIVVILDQFEEFFLRFSEETRSQFELELAAIAENRHIDVKLIISIRADFFHHLTEFEPVLPNIFANQFHLDWLSAVNAQDAIIRPFNLANIEIDGNVVTDRIIPDISTEEKVDSPILQIVCDSLYRYAQAKEIQLIGEKEYDAIGNVKGALEQYLENTLDLFGQNRRTAQTVLTSMITMEGLKLAISLEDLTSRINAFGVSLDETDLQNNYLQRFIHNRIVRTQEVEGITHYELSHEVIVKSVESWINSTDREVRQIQDLVDTHHQAFINNGMLLEKSMLKVLRPFRQQLNFSQEIQAFIKQSESRIRRDRALNWGKLIGIVTIVFSIFLYLGTYEDEPIPDIQVHLDGAVNNRIWSDALIHFNELSKEERDAKSIFLVQESLQQVYPEIAAFKGPMITKQADEMSGIRQVPANPSHFSFSRDGELLAASFFDTGDFIYLWNSNSGALQQQFIKNTDSNLYSPFLFSADGKQLVKVYNNDIQFIDIASGKTAFSFRVPTRPWHMTQGDDPNLLFYSIGSTITVLDVIRGTTLKVETFGHSDINCLAVSSDSKAIAAGSESGIVTYLSAPEGWDRPNSIEQLDAHSESVNALSFSSDGRILASGGEGSTILLWDIELLEIHSMLEDHQKNISSLAFHPRRNLLASGSWDGTIRLWNVDSGENTAVLDNSNNPETWTAKVAFSPDGKTLAATGGAGYVRLWQLENPFKPKELIGHQNRVAHVKFDFENNLILTSDHNKILLWDFKTGKQLQRCEPHQDKITALAVHAGSTLVASASLDKTVRIWERDKPERMLAVFPHESGVTALAMSPDGKEVISGTIEGKIKRWSVQNWQANYELKNHKDKITQLLYTSDQSLLVSASMDKTVRIWDLKTKENKKILTHYSPVSSVSISPDGKLLGTTSGKSINIWDLESGKYVTRLYAKESKQPVAKKLLFSPDSQKLVASLEGGEMAVWDLRTRLFQKGKTDLRNLMTFQKNPLFVYKPVGSLTEAFDIDSSGEWLAYGADDHGVRFIHLTFDLDDKTLHKIRSILKVGISSCKSCGDAAFLFINDDPFDDNPATVFGYPKNFKTLTEQRLESAMQGELNWLKNRDGIEFYKNQLALEGSE